MKIDQFLDALKAARKLPSDYALAEHFGIQQATISSWRRGRTLPDEVWCVRLAKELGLDPGYVLACVAAERASRAKRPELARTWRDLAEKAGVLTIAALALVILAPADGTGTIVQTAFSGDQGIHYTKLIALGIALAAAWRALAYRPIP